MATAPPSRPEAAGPPLARRNRRTAAWLLAWIAGLMAVSLLVIWLRN